MSRTWLSVGAVAVATVGCLPDITVPPCETDDDCTTCGSGACHCSAGYCFATQGTSVVASVTLEPCTKATSATAGDACCSEAGELDPECVAAESRVLHAAAGASLTQDARLLVLDMVGNDLTLVATDLAGARVAEVAVAKAPAGVAMSPIVIDPNTVLITTPAPYLVDLRHPSDTPRPLLPDDTFGATTGAAVVFPSGRIVQALVDGRLLDLESASTAPRAVATTWPAPADQLVGFDDATVAATVDGTLRLFDLGAGASLAAQTAVHVASALVLAVPTGTAGAVLGIADHVRIAGLERRLGEWQPVETNTLPGAASALAALSGDRFVVVSLDGLTAWWVTLDGASASVTATVSFAGAAATAVTTEPNGLYAALSSDVLVHVDFAQSEPNWESASGLGTAGSAPLIAADGTIVAIGHDGRVRRFPARSAWVSPALWSTPRGGPSRTGWAPLE